MPVLDIAILQKDATYIETTSANQGWSCVVKTRYNDVDATFQFDEDDHPMEGKPVYVGNWLKDDRPTDPATWEYKTPDGVEPGYTTYYVPKTRIKFNYNKNWDVIPIRDMWDWDGNDDITSKSSVLAGDTIKISGTTVNSLNWDDIGLYGAWRLMYIFERSYTINQYTITWDGNNRYTNPTATTQNYATSVTIPSVTAVSGYTFTNWTTTSSGGTVVSSPLTMPAANTTYYAQSTANTYSLSYAAQCDNTTEDLTSSLVRTGGQGVGNVTYNSSYNTPTASAITGYQFSHWVTPAGNKGNAISYTWNVAANYTINAKFTPNQWALSYVTYTVYNTVTVNYTYVTNSIITAAGTVNFHQNYTTPNASPTITTPGYKFVNWDTPAGNKANNTSYRWDINNNYTVGANVVGYSLTVTFNNGGATSGSTPANITVYYSTQLQVPGQGDLRKTNYLWRGWKASDSETIYGTGYTVIYPYSSNPPTADSASIQLVAQWILNTNSVMWDAGGTTGIYTDDVIVGTVLSLPEFNPKRLGYTFKQWDITGGSTNISSYTVPEGTIPAIVAQWDSNVANPMLKLSDFEKTFFNSSYTGDYAISTSKYKVSSGNSQFALGAYLGKGIPASRPAIIPGDGGFTRGITISTSEQPLVHTLRKVDGYYHVYKFTTVGTYSISFTSDTICDVLIVGGGGGGGSGGGGAGGYVHITGLNVSASANPYSVVVGNGGFVGGVSGGDSSAFTYTGKGGGCGGIWGYYNNRWFNAGARQGGSGGGGVARYDSTYSHGSGADSIQPVYSSPSVGTTIVSSGNSGGSGFNVGSSDYGGGGGGSGGSSGGGHGGPGTLNDITGTSLYYAAGGGGWSSTTTRSLGGSGIGGNGGFKNGPATLAVDNTGSGGGGGTRLGSTGTSGGSGIVIIRTFLSKLPATGIV